jgi:FG-GAP-like repeat/Secretion system C-terminal sorting domain
MKIGILTVMLCVAGVAQAQLYTNASANLPDNGAKGASMDVRAADLDGDGDLDIVLANEFQPNTILINDGQGRFTNGTAGNLPQPSKDSEDVAIADFNRDGILDLIFCSEDDVVLGRTDVHEYYLGLGGGRFAVAPFKFPDSEANAVVVADINKDNLPDVLFGNKGPKGVFIGKGDGTFSIENERIPANTRTTQDLALADVDGDEDLDLFEANENGNILYLNDGKGQFTNVTSTHLPSGLNLETRKATFGDVDGDGDVDLFLSNVAFIAGKNPQNRLFLNDGTGRFTDATSTRLPFDNDQTIDGIFEDVDLDDDLDLVLANVFGAAIKIYLNDGKGVFTNGTPQVLGQNYVRDALGVIAADLDGDGFRDLYFCDRFAPASNRKDLLLLRRPTAVSTKGGLSGDDADLVVYPNPVVDQFFLKTTLKNIDTVQLYNIDGRLLHQLRVQTSNRDNVLNGTIAGLGLKPGTYLIGVGGARKAIFVH